MFWLIALVSLSVFLYLFRVFFASKKLLRISSELVSSAKNFSAQRGDALSNIVFLGDSLSVGVGAHNANESLAGLIFSSFPKTNVENFSVSGARVRDLDSQIDKIKDRCDCVVIQIGSNDIIRFQTPTKTSLILESAIHKLKIKSKSIVLLLCGDVGAAPFFPKPLRFIYHLITMKYHNEYQVLAQKNEIQYINLYEPVSQKKFITEPSIYFSKDLLHPSSEGYKLWADIIIPNLKHLPEGKGQDRVI